MSLHRLGPQLSERLFELCGPSVPGACLALSHGDDVVEGAYGVTSTRTGQPVATDTLFQIGSVTKVYTATLIMNLVDAGLLDLDASVRMYLPWFRVADPTVSDAVTLRHLLTHSSGFEGDDFTDTGRGDDALRRYVERLSGADQIHPLGEMFSYCNSGFSTLGCIIEAVTGQTWDAVLAERLADPLGITLATLPEEAILRSHAVGHLAPLHRADGYDPGDGSALEVAPVWAPPRSVGPAGTICSTAADVLTFGRMHAREGKSPNGDGAVLSAQSVAAMQREQIRLLDPGLIGQAWGLGWILHGNGVIGHDGATFGQYAFYRLHPATGVGMALLTNGPGARRVFDTIYREFFAELAGVPVPVAPQPPQVAAPLPDLTRFVGDYERAEMRIEVREADDGLALTTVTLGPYAKLAGEPEPVRFVGLDGDTVVTAAPLPSTGVHTTAHFVVPPGESKARWIHLGARATRRSSR